MNDYWLSIILGESQSYLTVLGSNFLEAILTLELQQKKQVSKPTKRGWYKMNTRLFPYLLWSGEGSSSFFLITCGRPSLCECVLAALTASDLLNNPLHGDVFGC